MTFLNLNIQDKQFVLFRIKRFIESLHRKKKVLKRHSEEYKKVINQIAFYRRISQKIQQCQGAVEYSLFTEENENEIFYISMILGMRGHYQTLKQLSEIRFTEDEKLHADLQKLLRRVLELDPTLFADYQELQHVHYRISIVPISPTVQLMIDLNYTNHLYDESLNEYQIWVGNLFKSFALLHDYESWRPNNFQNDKWMRCCPAPCTCYIEAIEEKMYRIICGNVFFNNYQHRHEKPPWSYWSNKAGFFFVI